MAAWAKRISALSAAPAPESEQSPDFVGAVIAGERWAERELFERYVSLVQSTLGRCLGSCHDLDDLTQEVFLHVFGSVKTLQHHDALRSFVYTIALRVARTDIRRLRSRRRTEILDLDRSADFQAVNVDPEVRDALKRVQAILDGMASNYRRALELRYLDGLPATQVAHELRVSIPTVNRWLTRALGYLSAEIESRPHPTRV